MELPDVPPEPSPEPSPFVTLPVSARAVVTASFELLAASQRPLRSASFYAGSLAVATMAPLALMAWRLEAVAASAFDGILGVEESPLDGPLSFALVLAMLGYVAVAIDARAIAAAIAGGQLEHRPVPLAGAVRLARRRFWRLLAASTLVIVPTIVGQVAGSAVTEAAFGPAAQVTVAGGVIGGVLGATPFAYTLSGIVLGEVGAVEAIRRSARLFRARPRLALTVAAFGVVSQLLLFLGLSAGFDLALRVTDVVALPPGAAGEVLGGLVIVVIVFGIGTLLFTAEALAATPQVHAFVALTHYARGLEPARTLPTRPDRPWEPWLGRGLAVSLVAAVIATVAGLQAIATL